MPEDSWVLMWKYYFASSHVNEYICYSLFLTFISSYTSYLCVLIYPYIYTYTYLSIYYFFACLFIHEGAVAIVICEFYQVRVNTGSYCFKAHNTHTHTNHTAAPRVPARHKDRQALGGITCCSWATQLASWSDADMRFLVCTACKWWRDSVCLSLSCPSVCETWFPLSFFDTPVDRHWCHRYGGQWGPGRRAPREGSVEVVALPVTLNILH